jgi:hypothetical protein
VVIQATSIAPSGYTAPGRSHVKGQVLELSNAEYTALGGASYLRAVSAQGGASGNRDTLGESFAASNATP